jgi:hypothetical protein
MAVLIKPATNSSQHHSPFRLLPHREWQDRSTFRIKPTEFKYPPIKPQSPSALQTFCLKRTVSVATLLWGECEDGTHTLGMGTWESIGTPKTSEFDCRGQNTSHCGVLHITGKLLKRRCRKWARMNHLDIYSTSYAKKKGRESNWQFDSRPLKVRNRPDPSACRWSATHRWKPLDDSYKFALDLILIGGLSAFLSTITCAVDVRVAHVRHFRHLHFTTFLMI